MDYDYNNIFSKYMNKKKVWRNNGRDRGFLFKIARYH